MVNKRDELRLIIHRESGQWPDPDLTDAIVAFVAAWMERYGDGVPDPEYDSEITFGGALNPSETRHMIAAWREEMECKA
jgi:hypothetical protein